MNMLQFSEAIKIKDGQIYNIELHEARIQRTTMHFFNCSFPLAFSIPSNVGAGIFKCRIVYDTQIRSIEYTPYQFRTINTLALIECNDIDYSYKYANRSVLNELFAQKGDADDILIVKNGLISDTSSANIVVEDANSHLFTPYQPLLQGTKRQYLIDKKLIREKNIRPDDLQDYEKIYLINAMIDLEDAICINTTNIKKIN